MDQDHFLFVEKYRPRTIDECILPVAIKNTFKGYVKQGRIPQLLISGGAGGGKCLDYDTEIEIMVSDEIYEKLFS